MTIDPTVPDEETSSPVWRFGRWGLLRGLLLLLVSLLSVTILHYLILAVFRG